MLEEFFRSEKYITIYFYIKYFYYLIFVLNVLLETTLFGMFDIISRLVFSWL
jgi:hypothetical protein